MKAKFIFPLLFFSTQLYGSGKLESGKWMKDVPFAFVENKGQFSDDKGKALPDVYFRGSAPGLDIYITDKGLSYVFLKPEEEEKEEPGYREKTKWEWCRIDMELKGAQLKKENTSAFEPETVSYNYYAPHCPEGITGVRSFRKVIVNNIYPGIDWVIFRGDPQKGRNAGAIKYEFIVHPGADPSLIRMEYTGMRSLKLDQHGNLLAGTSLGTITDPAPLSYYSDGTPVPTAFRLLNNTVSFIIPQSSLVPRPSSLIIDPPLSWSTFYGGTGLDGPRGVTVDNAGNFLAAGYSQSANFPTLNPGGGAYYQGVSSVASNAVIMKFSNAGVAQWVTYYSGSNGEWAWDIAADNNSSILVVGRTQSNNFPTLNPGGGAFFQNTMNGLYDGFILKFNSAGVRQWATIYGGNSADEAFAVAADPSGNFMVVGCSQSTNLSLFNPGGGAYYQAANAGIYDLFILKFNPACNMTWGTNFGGNSQDFFPVADAGVPMDVCSDLAGNFFVTGQTLSTNFPTQNPGGGAYFQAGLGGGFDAFFLKFNPACNLVWSTYYGAGTGDDVGFDIKTDKNGNVYATGYTGSATFPTLNPGGGAYFQGAFSAGLYDAFIAKFTNGGVRLWATYYGGNGRDIGLGACLDACDNYYVTGCTRSSNFSTQNPGGGSFFNAGYGGAGSYNIGDMFILKFSSSGIRQWATYLGGAADQWGEDLAADALGNLFVGGEYHTSSAGLPLVNPGGGAYYQGAGGGNDDAALLRFDAPAALTAGTGATAVLCNGGSTGTAAISISGGSSPYTYSWNPTGQSTQTITGLSAGTYTVTISDAACNIITASVNVTQPTAITSTAAATAANCGQSNGSASLTASGGTGAYTYSWNPGGQTSATLTGLSTGTFTVTVTDNNGCTKTEAVAVGSSSGGTVNITASTNVGCFGANNGNATSSISGGTSPYTYSWNNGQTTAGATGLSAGTYTITITDANGCIATQTVTITQPAAVAAAAGSSNASCNGTDGTASVTASGGTAAYTYSWNNGQTTATATGLSAGTYSVLVTDSNGCTQTASTAVGNNSGPTATATATATTIQQGQSTTLNGGGGGTYTWSPSIGLSCTNCQSPAAAPTITTMYCVTVSDSNGCTATACVTIFVEIPCPLSDDFAVPNAFSPNGDGHNDVFLLQGWKDCISEFSLTVYDRWGEKVFESSDPGKGWDGAFQGKVMDAAVFAYYISATNTRGEPFIKKGNISLLK